MTKKIVKEFYAGKNDAGSGLSLTLIVEDNRPVAKSIGFIANP